MISIIHPSRSRYLKALETKRKWYDAANNRRKNVEEWIISIDYNDLYKEAYRDTFGMGDAKVICNPNRSAVDAINEGAKVASRNILMVVSDDTEPCQGWDDKIIEATKGKKDFILKTQDGIQPWIITMPVMDRAYYNRFGYIYHPDYLHMFCDTELTCVADITGRKITSKLLFPHKHYSVTKQAADAVAKRNDSTWAQGEKLFLERYKRNFDLPKGEPIQDNGLISWLEHKVLKIKV